MAVFGAASSDAKTNKAVTSLGDERRVDNTVFDSSLPYSRHHNLRAGTRAFGQTSLPLLASSEVRCFNHFHKAISE